MLAGEALLEIGLAGVQRVEAGQALLRRARAWLIGAIRQDAVLEATERAEAGRILARLGDMRSGVGLDPASGLPDIKWVEVPAGLFRMGIDQEDIAVIKQKYGEPSWGFDNETPAKELFIDEFRISRYPITNAQYGSFVQKAGYETPRFWPEAKSHGYWRSGEVLRRWYDSDRGAVLEVWAAGPADHGEPFMLPNHPVVGVNWWEALAFTRWLTEQLQAVGKIEPGWQVRLPSEAEWEKAARSDDGRDFPWVGSILPTPGNYGSTGINVTSAVGCFPIGASPYGVEEMSGNVWEWTRSLYGDYPYPYGGVELHNREYLAAGVGDVRVLRGGSFADSSEYSLRTTARNWDFPHYWHGNLGFRVCSSPLPLSSGAPGL
jgi:formylglycine-generating enzyme required for sulfatase activity